MNICNLSICEHLLEIIEKQNNLIAKLVNENFEQENLINELMKNCSRSNLKLSE